MPCIGFLECPGTNELIKHQKNGLLISKYKNNRVHALEDGLRDLMGNRDLRITLGVNAKDEVYKYHPEIIVKQWEHIIEKYAALSF